MAALHQVLYGKKATPLQRRLYEAPHFRGYSNDDKDPERFEAVYTMALWHAKNSNEQVQLIVPQSHVVWVLEQIEPLVRAGFRNIPGKEGKLAMKRAVYQVNINPGSQALRLGEPKHWMMFGFRGGPGRMLPVWTVNRLIEDET